MFTCMSTKQLANETRRNITVQESNFHCAFLPSKRGLVLNVGEMV